MRVRLGSAFAEIRYNRTGLWLVVEGLGEHRPGPVHDRPGVGKSGPPSWVLGVGDGAQPIEDRTQALAVGPTRRRD